VVRVGLRAALVCLEGVADPRDALAR